MNSRTAAKEFPVESRRQFLIAASSAALVGSARGATAIPAKTVVLTFDDAVKSHRTFVAPLLKELNFRATFFVTHRWMDDPENFMTWRDIAEVHGMGFEIGNHAWTHGDFSTPRGAGHLGGELALVENELQKVGVPRPVSFAYCGNQFGPEAVRVLGNAGYRFARRGLPPEAEYGKLLVGAAFDPRKHHPLLIPSTGDAYPDWTFDHFKRVVAEARDGQAVVLQFHGVPDTAHPWVHTPPENFRRYMAYLKEQEFRVLALRDLERFVDLANPPRDPMKQARYPVAQTGKLPLPVEVEATRAELPYWTSVMRAHHYTDAERALVRGETPTETREISAPPPVRNQLTVRPYPGGRHPRIGFLEGAIEPMRGTKASIFLPWDPASYVVVDLPEAIFTNLGLLFLAHTHIPTIWNDRNIIIENVDWQRLPSGGLTLRWRLPNGVAFGASIEPREKIVDMEIFLENATAQPLTSIRTQVCVMLKGASGFNAQTNENKILEKPVAGVRAGDRWILTSWQNCGRVWANAPVPCFHSDPLLPDCAPGQTVRVRGRLWFHEGKDMGGPVIAARS